MAQLIVRGLEDEVVQRLKELAARQGRSAEAQHREILREALIGRHLRGASFKDLLRAIPQVGSDADFARRRDLGRPVEL